MMSSSLRTGTLTAPRQSVVQDAWGSGPPKGCPCSPEILCRAKPHLFKTPHDCRKPEFPSSPEHLYLLNSTSGDLALFPRAQQEQECVHRFTACIT